MNTLDDLRELYRLPQSKFAVLDGVPVHYTDEGEGPAIVLVHGSFLDLTSYEPWVPAFAGFRIVRYDRLRWGLTGQNEAPTIDYDDEASLLAALVDHLGLDRFVLAGSSSGGMTAAIYAARHSKRVERLVLINFPLGHGRIRNASEFRNKASSRPTPKAMIRDLFLANFYDPALVTEALVTRFADLMDREDPTGSIRSSYAQAALFDEEARTALLASLKMPTLVLWSQSNRTLPIENGLAAYAAVGAPDKHFVIVEGAGHMLPLEKGILSGRLVRRFVDGEHLPGSVGE